MEMKMIGRWNPRSRLVRGVVTEVRQVREWTPSDRQQKAEIVLDGASRFTLLGREPEEFIFRKPRRRGVDRDDVASLRIGDEVEIRQLDEEPVKSVVTHLTIVRRADG